VNLAGVSALVGGPSLRLEWSLIHPGAK